MRVAIAGGHGKIGQRLIGLLTERGDEVRSLDRKPEYRDELEAIGATPVVCDLETANEEEVAAALGTVDAIVFSAGAGPGSGSERKWTMDYGGAAKLIEAAKANGIGRYVIVSSYGADPEAEGDDTFAVYLRAKGKADAELAASGLDYTIVRPTGLTDEPGAGVVALGKVARGQIPRDDVAALLAAVLDAPNTIGKSFEAASGDTPIDQAVGSL
jgi:nucleoside-diphosphate-sugar epimerase